MLKTGNIRKIAKKGHQPAQKNCTLTGFELMSGSDENGGEGRSDEMLGVHDGIQSARAW